jgi:integrase
MSASGVVAGGLRVSEALALRPSDLEPEIGMIRVKHGKGDRARTIAIDPTPKAYAAIRDRGRLEQPGA